MAMLTTGVLITAAVIVALVAPGGRRQQWFQHKWGAAVLGIVGARVTVQGVEKIDPAANYVLASNHASLMDTCVLFGWLPMPFKFLAKRELLNVPFSIRTKSVPTLRRSAGSGTGSTCGVPVDSPTMWTRLRAP